MGYVRVWDPFVRVFHWSLVACVAANLWFTEDEVHRYIGYAAVGLIAARVLWGFVGPRHARFADWWPTPARVRDYVAALRAGPAPRHLGHNPLGALMMLALMALVLALGLSGWMLGLDAFWGAEWLGALHEVLADVLLGGVVLHVTGAIVGSVRHRENLVAAMIHGKKRTDADTAG